MTLDIAARMRSLRDLADTDYERGDYAAAFEKYFRVAQYIRSNPTRAEKEGFTQEYTQLLNDALEDARLERDREAGHGKLQSTSVRYGNGSGHSGDFW